MAASALADSTQGDTSAGVYDIDEIIVTASRRREPAFSAPFATNIQDAGTLQVDRQVRSVPEALRELPGIMVQKTGHGQGSPFIRGFTGLRTLFLIDGIRLNNSTFREGPNQYWNTVDPLGVQRLEVVKGPSSVMYGSDAVGGAVHAISRSAEDLDGVGWRGRAMVRGAAAESSLVFRPELALQDGDFGFLVGASFKQFGDLRAGEGTGNQPKTGYDETDADLKLTYDLDANRRVIAAVQHVDQQDAWRVHRTIYGKSWHGTTVGNELRRALDQRRNLAYLQYQAEDLATLRGGSLRMSLSHHRQEERQDRVRSDGRRDVQGTDVGTLGAWVQADVPANRGNWSAGAELYVDDVDSFRDDYNADGSFRGSAIQGPVADDATYTMADAFLQRTVLVGEGTEVTAGLRYTVSRANADKVEDPVTGERISIHDRWNQLTGSIRYSSPIGSGGHARIFGGISQGFRAPNLSDLTRFDTARSGEIETPVSGLDPEKFVSYEIGAKFVEDRWSGQFSFYYTTIREMIIRTPTGVVIDGDNEITKENSGDGFVAGIEAQARYRLSPRWQLFGNVAWMDGEVDTYPDSSPVRAREPLDRLMPARAYLGTRWQPISASLWLEALVCVADEQDKLSTRDQSDTDRIPPGGTPGYGFVTLRGSWKVSDAVTASFAAENLFDKNYRIHGSGLNEPGRNIVLSLFYSF